MILVSGLTFDAMGMDNDQPRKGKRWSWNWNWGNDNNNRPGKKNRPGKNNRPGGNQNTGAVGAPLDGGLLAALGVAGTAYVAARKKKKGIDE